jgi:hypothetical protein
MDEDFGIPGMGTYAAPGWGGAPTTEPTYTPPREDTATPRSQSQVPGTSGAPRYTPSSTPGGVASGNPGSAPSSPWGSLAGILGLNAPQSAAGAMKPGQGLKIAQLGLRMLSPPASPIRQGAAAPQLSTAGQNPQVAQFQQMFGVDYGTALAMLSMLHPGSTTMTPQQQAQNIYSGGAFQPPATPPSNNPLLPSSSMPTAGP